MKRRWLPKWVSGFRDRHGKARYRFRRKGQAQYLFKHAPGTEEFRQEYQACLTASEAPKIQPGVPDTKLGDAISYTLNQWEYLTRYVEDGRMPIDNNLLERDIRVFATGRKSWLFCDTIDGARASARHVQPDADLPRLRRRAPRVATPRPH